MKNNRLNIIINILFNGNKIPKIQDAKRQTSNNIAPV
jgi:hypothetical protein